MPLQQLLDADRIAILNRPDDRDAVIDAAARRLATAAVAAVTIGDSLHAREQLASTAIGHGVAIPHGRVAGLAASCGAFLRLAEPVDFGAADGQPVDLVLAMAVPEHSLQEHLQQLAELAEHFADAGFRERLRGAADLAELRRCLLQPLAQSLPPRPTMA
ncbi:MAG: PTS sugar transporter subunit IIA [Lysobacter sp.]